MTYSNRKLPSLTFFRPSLKSMIGPPIDIFFAYTAAGFSLSRYWGTSWIPCKGTDEILYQPKCQKLFQVWITWKDIDRGLWDDLLNQRWKLFWNSKINQWIPVHFWSVIKVVLWFGCPARNSNIESSVRSLWRLRIKTSKFNATGSHRFRKLET